MESLKRFEQAVIASSNERQNQEALKSDLAELVFIAEKELGTNFFNTLLSERNQQFLKENPSPILTNWDYMVKHPWYKSDSLPELTDLPVYAATIEKMARKLFGDIGKAWGFIEEYRIKQQLQAEKVFAESPDSGPQISHFRTEVRQRTGEIVEDITTDKRVFTTVSGAKQGRLVHVIPLEVIKLSVWKGWLEALGYVEHSQTGRHGITYSYDQERGYILHGSGLIHRVNGAEYLSFNDYFDQGWEITCSREDLEAFFTEVGNIYGVKLDVTKIDTRNLRALKESILKLLGNRINESIRHTAFTEEDTIDNFEALCKVDLKSGMLVSMGITDEVPNILFLQELERLSGKKCFLTYSKRAIQGKRLSVTHQIYFLLENIRLALGDTDYNMLVTMLKKAASIRPPK